MLISPPEALEKLLSSLLTEATKQMGCSTTTAVFLTFGVYLLLQHQTSNCVLGSPASSEMMSGNELPNVSRGAGGRRRASSLPMVLSQRPLSNSQVIRARLTPLEPLFSDLLVDETDDMMDFNKRQSDDYGHMRFGKRGEIEEKFDDYGHMRFGRDHI